MLLWIGLFILITAVAVYFRVPLLLWSLLVALGLVAMHTVPGIGSASLALLWLIFAAVVIPLNVPMLRKNLISTPLFNGMGKAMPTISQTEQEALDAGDVWWEGELFSGKPNFKKIRTLPKPQLTEEEQAFIDGPVEELCRMSNDWEITHDNFDLSPEAWQFIKEKGFFAMIIPKEYGGLGYSALAHSEVVMKLGSRSGSTGVTVMVPNSLGPGKLLMTYGTKEQKDYYLPRLARGEEIPCFGLTGPDAGSDAGAMPDNGVVCYGSFEGNNDVLGVRLNWDKRYITLAPVATLLGIAFKLYDPDHLLSDVEDRGITLALVKRDTEGVEVGKRHFPSNQAFMNGPIRGKDVFIPLDWIIGGEEYIGKGWSMLMECLADGRAISLPALGTAASKVASHYTGSYSRIRKQFRTPIGYFEGVEEVLAKIGGQTYAIESARLMVLSALDQGEVPSVISGVVKQQTMERMREVVNHAMDIHGGHGICMGPNNFLGRGYQLIPVGITVEGANILTRTMIIFGQGALRSHPYLLKEVEAFHNPDRKRGLKQFDKALFAHMGFIMSNVVRSFWMGITSARLLRTPGDRASRYYYRQLVRMSSAFALMTDACLAILGGSLKRREKISGRLADVLSNMYVISAMLKHYEDEGEPEEDVPLLRWACDDALFNIQTAMKGVMTNMPVPFIGSLLNFLIFPLTKPYKGPDDRQGHEVARLLLSPSTVRDRLTCGIYKSGDADDATGRVDHALDYVLRTEKLEKRLRENMKSGALSTASLTPYEDARDRNIITEDEYALLMEAKVAIRNAIKVDEFSFPGWKVETP
ncbi:MAG: acyl-CoA dehydrogenase [Gammaproteobacteria bacterium]|nr:acyl-CoA dehydrogenase [Gammaproteobacteria bacterium]